MNVPLPPGASTLPPLYDRWIQELLQAPIPEETGATCLDCAMCVTKDVQRTESDVLFNVRTKCCTYFPDIPNFLTGKILLDKDPSFSAGRARFVAQMLTFTIPTPLGIFPPPEESARYDPWMQSFGQGVDLRCPYYMEREGGLCGIWKYRNAKCSTWFCKHIRGRTGLEFWRSLNNLIRHTEQKLSIWCIHQLEAGDETFRQTFPLCDTDLETFQKQQSFVYNFTQAHRLKNRPVLDQTWGNWIYREREFYEQCARLVDNLTLEEIMRIGTPEAEPLANQVKNFYTQLTTDCTPDVLKTGAFKTVEVSPTVVRVRGYSNYDPIDLPRSIFEALALFDGSSRQDTLKRIEQQKGLQLTGEWIQKLYDFGILVPG